MAAAEKSQQIINNLQKFRVEIERVRMENEQLEKELEPYERWAEGAMAQLAEFSVQNDIDIGISLAKERKYLHREEISDSDSDIESQTQKRKYKKPKDLPFVVPDEPEEKRPVGRPRKSASQTGSVLPRQLGAMPRRRKIVLPSFPYPYYDIKKIVANNQRIVPDSDVTLSSPIEELFKRRPDLYYMAIHPAIVVE